MEAIYKYELDITGHQQFQVPCGAQLLCVKTQRDHPCIWARVNPRVPELNEVVEVYMYGTGHDCNPPGDAEYLGTFLIQSDSLVFHVWTKRS